MAQSYEDAVRPSAMLKTIVNHSFDNTGFLPVKNPLVGCEMYDLLGLLWRSKPRHPSGILTKWIPFGRGNETTDEFEAIGLLTDFQTRDCDLKTPGYSEVETGEFNLNFHVNDSKKGSLSLSTQKNAPSISGERTIDTKFSNIDLGKVVEKKIKYPELTRWLRAASGTFRARGLQQISPARDRELFIIYDVLFSEKFVGTTGALSSKGEITFPWILSISSSTIVTASGNFNRVEGMKPIAFKAGKIQVTKSRQGKMNGLRATTMDRFLAGFVKRPREESQESSYDESSQEDSSTEAKFIKMAPDPAGPSDPGPSVSRRSVRNKPGRKHAVSMETRSQLARRRHRHK